MGVSLQSVSGLSRRHFARRVGCATRPLLLAVLGALFVSGCWQEPSEAMRVTVRNDTDTVLVIHQCTGAPRCGSVSDQEPLRPGESVQVNTSDEGVHNWWYVTARGSRTALSCFDLYYTAYQRRAQWNLSRDAQCPSSLSLSG